MIRRHSGIAVILSILCMSLAGSLPASAQEVSVSYSADTTWVDTPIRVQFMIEDAQQIEDPVLPDQDGLEFEYLGVTQETSGNSFENGVHRSWRMVGLTITVTPTREGTFEIDPITIDINGTAYSSSPITLTAIAPRNDGRVIVELSGPERAVYLGESVNLRLSIWIEQYVSEEYGVEASESVSWQLVDLNQTKWGPFLESIQELSRNRQRPKGEIRIRDDRTYFVFQLDREVRPADIQELKNLTDVTIAASYPTGVRRSRSIFNTGLEFSGLIPLRVRAEVGDINVTPLPEEGRPADFRGAVGDFVVRASAKPLRVQAGDPISFSFLIGNVDQNNSVLDTLRPPPLDEIESLTRDFKIPSEPIAGTVDGNIKIFTQSIRPRNEDVTEIPSIPFSFFDPDLDDYRTLYTNPIPIDVSPAEMLASEDIVRSGNAERRSSDPSLDSGTDATKTDQALLGANFPVDKRLLSQDSISIGWGSYVVLAAPPLTFLAGLALVARRRWRERNPDTVRARAAAARGLGVLRTEMAPGEIGRQVRTYISDKAGRASASITSSEAIRLARSAEADPELMRSLEGLLRSTERSGYGGSDVHDADLASEASRIIRSLERCNWRTAGKVHS
ncbi:MAG: BatD family protein [Planctomycetota bacterium]|nr:BatD family protein [Planctomycetota bacterium]